MVAKQPIHIIDNTNKIKDMLNISLAMLEMQEVTETLQVVSFKATKRHLDFIERSAIEEFIEIQFVLKLEIEKIKYLGS